MTTIRMSRSRLTLLVRDDSGGEAEEQDGWGNAEYDEVDDAELSDEDFSKLDGSDDDEEEEAIPGAVGCEGDEEGDNEDDEEEGETKAAQGDLWDKRDGTRAEEDDDEDAGLKSYGKGEDVEYKFDLTPLSQTRSAANPLETLREDDAQDATDLGDLLGEMLQQELEKFDLHQPEYMTDDLDAWPYNPHPAAVEADKLFILDEHNDRACRIFKDTAKRVSAISNVIAGELRGALQARTTSRRARGVRRGKLDRNRLHMVNRPGAKPNRNVFIKKTQGQDVDTDVFLLVDESGSMASNNKIGIARASTIALGEALGTLAPFGVNFSIAGFTTGDQHHHKNPSITTCDRYSEIHLYQYKTWGEQWGSVRTRLGHMMDRWANCDGESVRWAANQLRQRGTPRRILIVLSDGYPAVETMMGYERLQGDLKNAVREAMADGIEVLGIGICSDAVEQFYPDCMVINNPEQLQGNLMARLRKMFGLAS